MSRTTQFLIETTDGFFLALLDNGGVRLGLKDHECFDYPADHPRANELLTLTAETIEEAYDKRMDEYVSFCVKMGYNF